MLCNICETNYTNQHNKKECKKMAEYYHTVYANGNKNGWHTVVDFTMTACNRTELIDPTCESLKQNIHDLDITKATIYCNVDPLLTPDTEDNVKKCLQKHFGTVIVNKPTSASFAKAVKWCWTQSDKPLTFHLEDDWRFLSSFKVANMFKMMINKPIVSSVQLYKGEFQKGQTGLIRLSPSVHKSEYIKRIAQLMNDKQNPEGQLRHNNNPCIRGGAAIYLGLCFRPNVRLIRDIGIKWRKEKKIQHKVFFNSWNVR